MGVICAFPSQGLLEEADEEKKRLQGENEMLKALMKKEVDRLDSELAAKADLSSAPAWTGDCSRR